MTKASRIQETRCMTLVAYQNQYKNRRRFIGNSTLVAKLKDSKGEQHKEKRIRKQTKVSPISLRNPLYTVNTNGLEIDEYA